MSLRRDQSRNQTCVLEKRARTAKHRQYATPTGGS